MFGAGDTQRIEVELGNRPYRAAVRTEVRSYWRNGQIWKLHLTSQQSRRGWKAVFRAKWNTMFRPVISQAWHAGKSFASSVRVWSDGWSTSKS